MVLHVVSHSSYVKINGDFGPMSVKQPKQGSSAGTDGMRMNVWVFYSSVGSRPTELPSV